MSLLVVGALHSDVVVTADRLPRIDETLRGHGVDYRLGGKGGNQAIAARRAGAEVAFAGRIGGDEAGRSMQAVLAAEGVGIAQLQHGSGPSGMSVAITVADGGYGAVIVSGENLEIDASRITIPEGCRCVLIQNELAADLLPAIATKARRSGAELWLNAAPATGLAFRNLRLADVIIVNRIEGADLLGIAPDGLPPEDIVAGLRRLAPEAALVLTLGGDGVCFAAPMRRIESLPARRVKVISTHGAGDVFVGTMAAARLAGRSMAEAIGDAQDAAARHISQIR